MAPTAGINVLFVPYRPPFSSEQGPIDDEPQTSLQKHAAREYHKKAKLQRLAGGKPAKQQKPSKGSASYENSLYSSSRRSLLPRHHGSFNEPRDRKASSISNLELGAGKLDPFNVSVPRDLSPYVLEILDHSISYQWPVFSTSKTVVAVGNIKNAVLACAMSSPASFYTIIFAGATHNAYAHAGMDISRENKMLRLNYKLQAIKALNSEIQALKGEPSDELLLCMITLAAHGSGEQLAPPKRAHSSPLATAQNFEYYGNMRWEMAHLTAIGLLIGRRGGLHKVKMPGLANAIELAGIFIACQNLAKPSFPLLVPTSTVMSCWPSLSTPLRPSHKRLCTGFESLPSALTSSPLLSMIQTIRTITIGFSMYLSRDAQAPSLARIMWARNSIEHDLLSLPLPPASPAATRPDPDTCLYEVIRLATQAYMILVLFPVPRVAGVHPRLAAQLMLALNTCTLLGLWEHYPGLLLWSTILGGMVCHDDDGTDGSRTSTSTKTNTNTTSSAPTPPLHFHHDTNSDTNRDTNPHSKTDPATDPDPDTTLTPATVTTWFIETTTRAGVKHEPGAWSLVRETCSRFLWFEGDECEGSGRAFWNIACARLRAGRG